MSIDLRRRLLTDRVAVVTGGGAGIGRGIAAGLTGVRRLRRDLGTRPRIVRVRRRGDGAPRAFTTDVRDSAQVDAALAQTVAELGPVTILVNNAGACSTRRSSKPAKTAGTLCIRPTFVMSTCAPSGCARQSSSGTLSGQRHQRHVDRRRQGRPWLRDIRRRQGRSHQLHQDRRARIRPARRPGQCAGTRYHPDRGHHADRTAGIGAAIRLHRADGAGRSCR